MRNYEASAEWAQEIKRWIGKTLTFAAAVEAAGKLVTLAVMESYNHFEVMEQLGNPYGLFGRAALEQMRLAARWLLNTSAQ